MQPYPLISTNRSVALRQSSIPALVQVRMCGVFASAVRIGQVSDLCGLRAISGANDRPGPLRAM